MGGRSRMALRVMSVLAALVAFCCAMNMQESLDRDHAHQHALVDLEKRWLALGHPPTTQGFLSGSPLLPSAGGGLGNHDYRVPSRAWFVQDDWRARADLFCSRWEDFLYRGGPESPSALHQNDWLDCDIIAILFRDCTARSGFSVRPCS